MGAVHPFARLVDALEAEGIRFIVIGMSAAIAQGVLGTTMDIDLWIDLPSRQYMRVQNIARKLGGTVAANTVVYMENGVPVNFVFEPAGLRVFRTEHRGARRVLLHGRRVPVLPLERIMASKRAIRRDKDLLHLKLIGDFLKCRKEAAKPGAGRRSRKPATTAPVKARPAARRPARPA